MKKIFLVFLMTAAVFLTSCSPKYTEDTFFCMDTAVTVRTNGYEGAKRDVRELLMELDTMFSRYAENSCVKKYNDSESGAELTEELKELILYSKGITDKTSGAFSVFSGSLVSLWRDGTSFPEGEQIKKALDTLKSETVFEGMFLRKDDKAAQLDFGAIAKGYACDKAIELLKEKDVGSAIVSFSSSIGVIGKNPKGEKWKVAIKDPTDTSKILGYVLLEDSFMSVSGDYERFYEIDGQKYNHIIDTRSGYPVSNGTRTVAVVAKNGAESDALSTAFFVMGYKEVERLYGESDDVGYIIVADDGIYMNDAMKKVFTKV